MDTRIISLLPAITEILCYLDQGKNIVAKSHECDFPKEIEKIPSITKSKVKKKITNDEISKETINLISQSISLFDVNVEKLKSLKPDIIFTQEQCAYCSITFEELKNLIKDISNKKIDLINLNIKSIKDIIDSISTIGEVLKLDKHFLNDKLDQFKFSFHKVSNSGMKNFVSKKVMAIEWLNPLMTAGFWVPEMLKIAGSKDQFHKHHTVISNDEIINYNPDIIIFMLCGYEIENSKKNISNFLSKDKRLLQTSFYKNKSIYICNANSYFSRPGPRIIEGQEILNNILAENISSNNDQYINFFNSDQAYL